MEYNLLVGCISMLMMGYIISITNTNPTLCMSLSTRFLCKKNGLLDKLFTRKECRSFPHSILRIIELLFGLIITPVVLVIYALFWIGKIDFITSFVNSPAQLLIGAGLMLLSFIYPVILICIDAVFRSIEKKMNPNDYKKMEKLFKEYYDNINR